MAEPCLNLKSVRESSLPVTYLCGAWLRIAFGGVTPLSGIRILTAKSPVIEKEPQDNPWLGVARAIPFGIVTGIIGIGGGVLPIPVMALALRLKMHNAVATPLAIMIFTSIGGVIGYIINDLDRRWRLKMEVLKALKTRRSIRKYKTTPVDDKTIELVLQAAQWAPSWANTQCWRFIVVWDTSIKSELADTLSDNNTSISAIRQAPVVIVACAELGKSGYYKGQPATDKGDWFMFDVALAMQNLVLGAHSLGLGTVHIGAFDAKKVEAILGVPAEFCVVEMIPLGYPDEEPKVRPRKKLSEIVFYDKFVNSFHIGGLCQGKLRYQGF